MLAALVLVLGVTMASPEGASADPLPMGPAGPDRLPIPGAIPDEERAIDPPDTDGAGAGGTGDTEPDGADLAASPQDTAPDDGVRTASGGFAVRLPVWSMGDIEPDIRMYGQGWGHSVGFSQIGAHAQALAGRSAEDILTSYYPGTEVTVDPRGLENRIRVGIAIAQTATPVLALDEEVTWQLCTPEELPVPNSRVPAERCAEWFTQEVDEQLRVRPLPATGAVTPVGSHTHLSDDLQQLDLLGGAATPTPTAPSAPAGGFLVERLAGEDDNGDPIWEPHRAYVTPDDDRPNLMFPVVRVLHGEGRIQAQSYQPPERNYRFGWRDLHLTGLSGADPASYRLAIVQDVDSVEAYLRGLAEVPSSWPGASLEAQAIAGRTYALLGSRGGACLCDRYATAADQVFIGESKVEERVGEWEVGQRWAEAVRASAGQVLTYETELGRLELAQTYYSSSFGGRSENVEDSWAFYRAYQGLDAAGALTNAPAPYLRSVDDPWSLLEEVDGTSVSNSRRNWTAAATQEAFLTLVNRERDEPFVRIERLRVGSRTDGGTPRTILVTGVTADGVDEDMTYRGLYSGSRELTRPIAANILRFELPLIEGIEPNERISSTQIQRFGFGPFTDDDGSVHEYAITWAATAGIVQGLSEDSFAPGSPVTRAQMATFLDNTFSLPRPDDGAATFPDVPVGSTHHRAIEAIAAAGITLGYGDGTYRPGGTVTRQELAAFLARAQALVASDGAERVRFADVSPGSTHADSISAVATAGITSGCDEDRFCPGDPVTRGQLATFMYRSATRR